MVSYFVVSCWLVLILLVRVNSAHSSDVCTGLSGLLNCGSFLLGGVSSPDSDCCKSLKWLSQHAAGKEEDKRELCKCLKVEGLKKMAVIPDRAKLLPTMCHVLLPVPLIPDDDTNCDKIQAGADF